MKNLLEKDIVASIGTQTYYVEVIWRNGVFVMDEPVDIKGQDLGPDPYATLLASLAGCTLSTLRMYIDRKGWEIPSIKVSLNMSRDEANTTYITRSIRFPDSAKVEYHERLIEIAKKCPVSKILENKIEIGTNIVSD